MRCNLSISTTKMKGIAKNSSMEAVMEMKTDLKQSKNAGGFASNFK